MAVQALLQSRQATRPILSAVRWRSRIVTEVFSTALPYEPERETPACAVNDGVDYVPTRASVLFGHHFSSIAGAGPIVGPIIAASVFGWLPTWLWILVGAVFIGGVHDFGSTLMSLRYGGRSITSTCRKLVGEGTGKLFLLFVLLALVYV